MKIKILLSVASLISAASGSMIAGEISKADNTTGLNDGNSWVGGIAPGTGDIAVWDSTVTANRTAALGADTEWSGIKLAGAVGQQIITGTANTVKIGAEGIDFTGAVSGSSMGFQTAVLLTADQTWSIANSHTGNTGDIGGLNQSTDLAFVAQTSGASFNLGGNTVTITSAEASAGTVVISSGYAVTNGTFKVDAGILVFQSGGSRNVSVATDIEVASGATVRFQANSSLSGAAETAVISTGTITMNGGTLTLAQNNDTANNTIDLQGQLILSAGTENTVDISRSLTSSGGQNRPTKISGNITGDGKLILTRSAGSAELTITGTNNYTGGTEIRSGVVNVSNNGTVGTGLGTGSVSVSGGKLVLGSVDAISQSAGVVLSGAGTVDIGTTNQTLKTLDAVSTGTASYTGKVTGTGKVTVTESMTVGGAATATATTATLDLSELGEFVFNNATGTVSVGGQSSSESLSRGGVLTLAEKSTITAESLNIQTTSSGGGYSSSNAATGTLNLGKDTTLNTDSILLATSGRDNGYIQYATETSDASLVIRGTAGGDSRADITMGGHNTTGGARTQTVTIDLTTNVSGDSALDAKVGTLTVGSYSRGYGASGNSRVQNANFLMGKGVLDAETINIGVRDGNINTTDNAGALNALFSVTGGTVIADTITVGTVSVRLHSTAMTNTSTFTADGKADVTVRNLVLGAATTTNDATILESAVNLNGGTTLAAQTISAGAGNATRTFNWNDGTIKNYDAGTGLSIGADLTLTLADTGLHAFEISSGQTGIVNAVIEGNGVLTKTGEGTLTLVAANTYTGVTTVIDGTLEITGSIAGTVNVAGGKVIGTSDVTLTSGAQFLFDLNAGDTAVDIDGLLNLNNATLHIVGTTSETNPISIAFFDDYENTFAGLANDGILTSGDGQQFTINYNTNSITLTLIPEPSTYAFGAAGLLGALVMVRRRFKKK